MNPKKTVELFIKATNDRNWQQVADLLGENVQRHSSTFGQLEVCCREDFIHFHKAELETFPDLQESIQFMISEGDMVAARINFRGTQTGQLGKYPPSGNILDADFNCFFKVTDGKITETWVEYDVFNGLIQLGHIKQ